MLQIFKEKKKNKSNLSYEGPLFIPLGYNSDNHIQQQIDKFDELIRNR